MYFIAFKEGGYFKPVHDNRAPYIIVEELKKKYKTFICEFDSGVRYDTLIEKEGMSSWDTSPSIDVKIEEFIQLNNNYLQNKEEWDKY